jgi:hypothetical protein
MLAEIFKENMHSMAKLYGVNYLGSKDDISVGLSALSSFAGMNY